jgi:hypothetical protein
MTMSAMKRSVYKRRLYCMEKLKLMTGHKTCNKPSYTAMVKRLSQYKEEIHSMYDLRKKMKKLKYNKYYKYIYSIYYDIFGRKPVPLTYNQIDFITEAFVRYDCLFKLSNFHCRRNMLSYTTLIYYIMKKLNLKCKKNLLLPNNHKKTICTLKSVLGGGNLLQD